MMPRPRALLIEDNPVDRSYVRFMMRSAKDVGISLDEAGTAEEAMRLISHNQYSLVISDHHLLGPVTGLDILNQLGQRQPNCRRMLLTSDTRYEIMQEAFWRNSADRVVRKSAGTKEILANVAELLNR